MPKLKLNIISEKRDANIIVLPKNGYIYILFLCPFFNKKKERKDEFDFVNNT